MALGRSPRRFAALTIAAAGIVLPATLLPAATYGAEPVQAAAPVQGPKCATGGSTPDVARDMTVGSYNITAEAVTRNVSGYRWKDRLPGLVDFLARCTADVYTTQENSTSIIQPYSDNNYPRSLSQFEDLRNELNEELARRGVADRYEYVNAARETCRSSANPSSRGKNLDPYCTYGTKAQSPPGNRILYNTATVAPARINGKIDQGVMDITISKSTGTLHWARLKKIQGSRYALVATTHLNSGDGKYYNYRMSKTDKIRAKLKSINAKNHDPIVLTGDFNSYRSQMQKLPAEVLRADTTLKMTDITGQDYTYYKAKSGKKFRSKCVVPANHRSYLYVPYKSSARKNMFFDSGTAANLLNNCKSTKWNEVGFNIDYIFTTREWRPQAWETVVNRKTNLASNPATSNPYANPYGLKTNPNPSDHNLIMARLRLP